MVPSQIERLLKISNNNPLFSHTKIPPNHNIFLYIYIYIYPPLSTTNSTQGQSLQIHHPYSHIGSKVHHLIFHTCTHIFIYLLFIFNLHSPLGLFEMRTKLGKGTIFYIIQNQAYTDTITFYYSPKPQISKPAQNRTQESSFTLNATQGTEKNK